MTPRIFLKTGTTQNLAMCVLVVLALFAAPVAIAEDQKRLAGLSLNGDQHELYVGGAPVRLYGVHFPSEAGLCSSEIQGCRRTGLTALAEWLDAPEQVECEVLTVVTAGTHIARCKADETDLGAWLVTRGFALADRPTSRTYLREEQVARSEGAGLWAGLSVLAQR